MKTRQPATKRQPLRTDRTSIPNGSVRHTMRLMNGKPTLPATSTDYGRSERWDGNQYGQRPNSDQYKTTDVPNGGPPLGTSVVCSGRCPVAGCGGCHSYYVTVRSSDRCSVAACIFFRSCSRGYTVFRTLYGVYKYGYIWVYVYIVGSDYLGST